MKTRAFAVATAAFLLSAGAVHAQTPQTGNKNPRQGSYEEFRQRIHSDYKEFRRTILDNYADFLQGEWHEYKSLNGTRADKTPKPKKLPTADSTTTQVPKPNQTIPGPATMPEPAGPSGKTPDALPLSDPKADGFFFFGMPVKVSRYDYTIEPKLYSNNDYAAQWRSLDKQGVGEYVAPAILRVARDAGLNGWFTYNLVEAYADSKFPNADPTSRFSLVHYLMAQLGYDARIATTSSGIPMILLPFDKMVHARTFLVLDGKKFYIFTPEGTDQAKLAGEAISTCRIPSEINTNSDVDLTLGELKIPFKAVHFDRQYGALHLEGDINANIIPMLYRYPQMPLGDYALCNPQPGLREEVGRQIREQLGTLEPDAAVESLLGFMHRAFEYATDEEYHGFEKPYFIEETLFYPKNDCEDRAIFYTYYLWNSLAKPSQLVTFPGHAAATVQLEQPAGGTSYTADGKTWWISDPTYTGSHTGMVMPMFKAVAPTIERTFPK